MCKAVIDYRGRKFLSGIDVSEKAGKVSKTANTLDVRRLPVPLITSKMFLRRNERTGFKQSQNQLGYPRPYVNEY
ncbi:hypothetical protein TNCV_3687941 [Trichonephila clavipes]|nr:hypothetical protein TNCV_3687941 [Trichonephila clavipes]